MALISNRYFKILICVIVLSSSLVLSNQKAKAFLWVEAVPAGVISAGGAYALGALGVGAVATAVGLEYGDEINAHASRVWNGSTKLAKDTFDLSIQATVASGNYVQKIGSDFWDWVTGSADKLAGAVIMGSKALMNLATSKENASEVTANVKVDEGGSLVSKSVTLSTAYPDVIAQFYGYQAPYISASGYEDKGQIYSTYTFPSGSEDAFAFSSNSTGLIQFRELAVNIIAGTVYIYGFNPATDLGTKTNYGENLIPFATATLGQDNIFNDMSYSETVATMNKLMNSRTVEGVIDTLAFLGLDNFGIGNAETWEEYDKTRAKILEQDIPRFKDAGLVLPVNDVVAYEAGNPAKTLTYDADAGVYVNQDGVVYEGDVVYDFPKATVVTGADGIPYIVTNVDGIPVDITTGIAVPTVDAPATGGGTGTGDPTKDWKTRMKALVTTKFPFSLPWDFYAMLSFVNADPIQPEFKIDTEFMGMPVKFDKKIDYLQDYLPFFRTFIIIGFCISLILMTRKLLGGSI